MSAAQDGAYATLKGASYAVPMPTRLVEHPVAQLRLATLRNALSTPAQFRAALEELSSLLIVEATRDLPTEPTTTITPLGHAPAVRLVDSPLLVTVLRAGLGMAAAGQRLFPEADLAFVGVARDEATHEPVTYLDAVPRLLSGRPVLLLDPMLATGGSLAYCLDLLRERGAGPVRVVCVLAAPEGIARIEPLCAEIVTAAIDDGLDEHAFIVPGLGDAGDRQFGPR